MEETKLQTIYDDVNDIFDQNKFKSWIAYEQEDLIVSMNFLNNVWSLCVRDVLMIDFDLKEGVTRDDAIQIITNYTDTMHKKGHDLLFEMFDTDRGVHAFLVSEPMSHKDPVAIKMMVDLHNDPYYIGFSKVRGFCMRLNAKINMKVGFDTLQEMIDNEFISKRFIDNPYIGYGTPDAYVQNVISLHTSLINWFKYQYKTRLGELTEYRYVYEIDRYQMAPPESFLEEVTEAVIERLKEFRLKQKPEHYKLTFDVRTRPHEDTILKLYEQKGLRFIYDLYYGIWAICTPFFLMIDFDENEDFSKLDAIEVLRDFVHKEHAEGNDYLFWIYDTDRGIHAFLMNHPSFYNSELTEYILNALDNDPRHIDFVLNAGHCTRLAPKRSYKGAIPTYIEEFVARKCSGDVCEIGYGVPLPYFTKILILHGEMIDYLKMMYKTSFRDMNVHKYIIATNSDEFVPKDVLLEQIRRHFITTLVSLDLEGDDITFKNNFKPTSVERYEDLISDNALSNCRNTSMKKLMGFIDNILRPNIIKEREHKDILLRSEAIPFIISQDQRTHMIFLKVYDLLMLDWDVKDGIDKSAVVPMLERFINGQSLLPENKRLFKSTPCFKIYETDHGVHAYLISHRVPHNTEQSSAMMMSVCCDYFYTAFSRVTGYSIRLSPKVYDRESDSLYDEEIIRDQFVQNPGIDDILYVGNGIIDQELEAMVDMIYKLQQYVLEQPAQKIIDHDIKLQDDVVEVASFLYRTMRPKYMIDNPKWIFELDN